MTHCPLLHILDELVQVCCKVGIHSCIVVLPTPLVVKLLGHLKQPSLPYSGWYVPIGQDLQYGLSVILSIITFGFFLGGLTFLFLAIVPGPHCSVKNQKIKLKNI